MFCKLGKIAFSGFFIFSLTACYEIPFYKVEIFDLPDKNGKLIDSVTFSITDKGQAIGTYSVEGERHGYLWTKKDFVSLGDAPGGAFNTVAYDVNDDLTVVGVTEGAEGHRAFMWQKKMHLLPQPDGAINSMAYGINSWGDIVGVAGSPEQPLPVLWLDLEPIYLGALDPALPFGEAYDINSFGSISGSSATPAGSRAVIWHEHDQPIELGVLEGAEVEFGVALQLNNVGEAVGMTAVRDTRHAFYYSDGRMHDLGDLPGGGDLSIAYGLNDFGVVVGSSQVKDGEGGGFSTTEPALLHHAFIWTKFAGMVDLNDRIVEHDAKYKKITLLEAAVISNRYQVTGRALVDGKIRGYRLVPVEEKRGRR